MSATNNPSSEQQELTQFEIKEREKRRCYGDIIDPGAKLLFCFLIDNSWLYKFGGGTPGTICISVSRISTMLRVGPRSVSRWSKCLSERGYLWISRRSLPNCKPINVYHLSCLCPPHPDAIQTSFSNGGMWGASDDDFSTANLAVVPETPENDSEEGEENGESDQTGQNGSSHASGRHLPAANLAAANGHNGHGQVPLRHVAGAKLATGSGHNGHGQVPLRHVAGAKLATGTCQVGSGQVPKSDVIRRLQTQEKGESIGEGKGAPLKTAPNKAFKLPTFAPIPADIFPSKLPPMIRQCEKEIRRIEAAREFQVPRPTQSKNIVWLLSEAEKAEPAKAKELRDKAEKLKGEVELVLSDDGKALIQLYRTRIREIQARITGIEVAA